MNFRRFIETNSLNGRIGEIIALCEEYYNCPASELSTDQKLNALCFAQKISPEELDEVISSHSEVLRTVKGHAFEVVFDYLMSRNGITCIEVGGDGDTDRIVNGYTLQLKTPYVNGCSDEIVSYKTHKTHGAKSEQESMDYYHRVSDFADFLVGLISYDPLNIIIVPKEDLPRVGPAHIQSPMYLNANDFDYVNNFSQLGIRNRLSYSRSDFVVGNPEALSLSSKAIDVKSEFILRAIFIRENFRLWDMNMRGFIREKKLESALSSYGVHTFPVNITGRERSDKCDIVLRAQSGEYVRFQVKGLTWNGCRLNRGQTIVDCETQLSRGRVNDHPTQSRLYKVTDYEYLIVAIDPPYTNSLSLSAFGTPDYNWRFYAIPMADLRKHPTYPNRVFSHQKIPYDVLQRYLIEPDWFYQWL